MNSSEETCLLCLSTNKNMIKFYSETAKELNVVSILSTHFWFQLDETKLSSKNICRKCWKQTESFHEFYQSVRAVHKKFETVFVKIENDPAVTEDDGEILLHNTITDIKLENDLNIDDDQDCENDEYLHEIPYANPIDTENKDEPELINIDTYSKNKNRLGTTTDEMISTEVGVSTTNVQSNNDALPNPNTNDRVPYNVVNVWDFGQVEWPTNTEHTKYQDALRTVGASSELLPYNNDLSWREETQPITETTMHTTLCETATAFESVSSGTLSKYQRAYVRLLTWKTGENIEPECFSEAVMLEYFHYLKSKYKPSSLWAVYSMLKATIKRNDNIDISYPEVISMLKNSFVGFQSQSSNVFQPEELRRFLTEADDVKYLAVKVITIFVIYGANRKETLSKVNVSDVTKEGSVYVIKFPEQSTNVMRSYTLENEYGAYVQKYIELRPKNLQLSRFFVTYHNGECRKTPIGKQKFTETPKIIAKFLNLKDADNYTLQSFRKKSKRWERNEATEIALPKQVKFPSFDLLPKKSQEIYMRAYRNLSAWKTSEDIDADCFSREVLLDYFNYMKTKYKPNSMWAQYAKLTTTIQKHNNIDIYHPQLTSLLKLNSVLSTPQTTYTFQLNDMRRFLDQARDYDYLDLKVIMIFCMHGVGSLTLSRVDINDVSVHGSVVVLKLKEKRNDNTRSYTLDNEYATFVQKYQALRPENLQHTRFFLQYKNGKCTAQPLGPHKITNAPKIVAKFLDIKDGGNFSMNSFHIKSQRKLYSGKSVPNNFIEECIPAKRQIEDEVPVTAKKICKDTTALELLPGKSKERYIKSYETFIAWKISKGIDKDCFSEELMFEYLNYLKPKYKASSLWTEYSILRTTIQKNDKIDIAYPKLKSFMRDISASYQSQKSNEFRPDEILKFFSKADDNKFLALKVAVIFGMYAAISAEDLMKVEVNDVTEDGSMTVLKAPDRKSKGVRSFIVDSEYAAYVQKYAKLRPKDTPHNRFFLNYQNGKCTVQAMGRNKIVSIPKVIAKYLNLEDAENYRFNSFSKTLSTYHGHGGLRSSNVADDSTEESNSTNGNIDDIISERMSFERSSEPVVTSTITNSTDISAAATFQTAFQTYNFQPHQIPPLHYMQSGQKQALDGMGTSNIPTAFQSYHVPPHQV